MVFSIILTSLWVVNCVAEQGLHPAFHSLAAPAYPFTAIAPLPIPFQSKSQYHYQDGFGFAKYGHSEPTSAHHASHDAYGNKAGEFSYVKPDGTLHKTRYIADHLGYRVESNDLPVGPAEVPIAHSLAKRSAAYPYAGVPTVSPSGYLADTPEVAAAKASHFQEHAKRGNYQLWSPKGVATPYAVGPAPYTVGPTPYTVGPASYTVGPASYTVGPTPYASWSTQVGGWPTQTYSAAPTQHPIVTPEGYLMDTPEVAHAKAAHFAEKAKAVKYDDYPYETKAPADDYKYYPAAPASAPAPLSIPADYNPYITAVSRSGYGAPITPDGQVTDTPEVSAAKASHYAEYTAALARNAGSDGGYAAPIPQQYSFPTAYPHAAPAVPAETPEVAQAKAAHFSEYARVANRLKRSISYGTYPASTQPLVEPVLPAAHPFLPHHPISPLPYSLPFAHPFKTSLLQPSVASSYHWSA